MKKLLLTLVMLIVALLCPITSSAYDFSVQNGDGVTIYYNINSDWTSVSVTYKDNNYNSYSDIINIPSSVSYDGKTYSVTSIGDKAFYNCSGLTSVTIPESVTSIGNNTFFSCSGLTEVIIPNSVSSIGYGAFGDCFGLKEVIIGKSLTDLDDSAFNESYILEKVVLPSALSSVNCFVNYATKVVYNPVEGFVYENGLAFNEDKTNLIYVSITAEGEISIPESVTSIGDHAFSGCSGLTEVTIPENVTYIGDYAFSGCSALTTVNFNATNCSTMGPRQSIDSVFRGCNNFSTLNIGENVTKIPDYAFLNCSGLTEVTIPESVTYIGDCAFSNCTGLIEVTIPKSITTIGNNAFYNCTNLAAFYGELASEDHRCLVLDGCLLAFARVGLSSYSIPNTVTSIGRYAFFNCCDITEVIIPNSVVYIGFCAFHSCHNLTKAIIGKSVTTIGNNAFWDCYGLSEMTVPNSVTSIGDNAFYGCSSLTSLAIGNSVTSIGRYAFRGCSVLTHIVIPRHVETIGASAFNGCKAVGKIAIGCGVKEIGELAFNQVDAAASVCIAATTPPSADNNTFSNYYVPLYVPEESLNNYYECPRCWYRFEPEPLKVISKVTIDGCGSMSNLAIGDTFKLTASFEQADASLPYIFWRSSNPEVAIVDNFGNVTTKSDGVCEIIAETMYADGPEATYNVTVETNGIEDIVADCVHTVRPNDIYTLQGICLKRNATDDDVKALTPGLYIIAGRKVLVK